MRVSTTLLSLSALLSLAAAAPTAGNGTTNGTAVAPKAPSKADTDAARIEFEFELQIRIQKGVLEVDFELEIGDLEIDIDSDIPIPVIGGLVPDMEVIDISTDAKVPNPLPDLPKLKLPSLVPALGLRANEKRMMNEVKCGLPHTRLSPQAGEVFRAHFHVLSNATYSIPAFKHMTWKVGKDRFRVENHMHKEMVGINYSDNLFASQQFGLVCPDNCEGKACYGKDAVWDGKLTNRMYTVRN